MAEFADLQETLDRGLYDSLIFDVDDTLLKFHLPWNVWYEQLGILMREHVAAEFLEGEDISGWTNVRKQIKRQPDFCPLYVEAYQKFEADYLTGYTPNQQLLDTLPNLRQKGTELHIWSNNISTNILHALGQLGLHKAFRTIVARDTVFLGKPDIEGWEIIRGNSKVPPSRQLFVGDSLSDEEAAADAGIAFFHLTDFRESKRQ